MKLAANFEGFRHDEPRSGDRPRRANADADDAITNADRLSLGRRNYKFTARCSQVPPTIDGQADDAEGAGPALVG
jgi:hypothetical protein